MTSVHYPVQPSSLVGGTLSFQLRNNPQPLPSGQILGGGQTLALEITGQPRGTNIPAAPLGTIAVNAEAGGNITAYVTNANNVDATYNHQLLICAFEQFSTLSFSLKFRTPTEGWFTARIFGATNGLWPWFGDFQIDFPAN